MSIPIIDELLWNRLSRFWSTTYDPSDKAALGSIYEALFRVLDAEYVQLAQVNAAKSLQTITPFMQRRWLRLDLNRYTMMRKWLRYLSGANNALTANGLAACDNTYQNHARHWHLSFAWTVATGGVLDLKYPLVASAVRVWAGQAQLYPGRGYELTADGKGLHITGASAGSQVHIEVALDLSDAIYAGFRPLVANAPAIMTPTEATIPVAYESKFPLIALVVRGAPAGTDQGFTQSNRTDFSTETTFVPQAAVTAPGRVDLGVSVAGADVVQFFGLEPGDWDLAHQHRRDSVMLTGTSLISSVSLDFAVPPGAFGTLGFLGHEIQVFVGGRHYSPAEYQIDSATNTIRFATPLRPNVAKDLALDIEHTVEYRSANTDALFLHLHQGCLLPTIEKRTIYERFDDGGNFDDGDTPTDDKAVFDSTISASVVQLPLSVDIGTAELVVGGRLLSAGLDYQFSANATQLTVLFTEDVAGQTLIVTFRRETDIYTYTAEDLQGQYGFRTNTDSLASALEAFQQAEGVAITDAATMLEAARIAAAGGNPFLALFYDEFPTLAEYPLAADGQTLDPATARNLESSDTALVHIPYLVDHVLNPTVRLVDGQDYHSTSAGIMSGIDLLASRGSDDTEPGVWWCPLVLLDEKLLAKNFGALVGDLRSSSALYRDLLYANFALRYNGPTLAGIASAVAAYLGSRVFTQDATVLRYVEETIGYTVVLGSDSVQQHVTLTPEQALPELGLPVYPGASVGARPLYETLLAPELLVWAGRVLKLRGDFRNAQAGDVAHLLLQAADGSEAWLPFTIESLELHQSLGMLETWITLKETTTAAVFAQSVMRVMRDAGAPYAAVAGTVRSVTPITRRSLVTTAESLPLLADVEDTWKIGDSVTRGAAAQPALAAVYDASLRPDWHWMHPQDTRHSLQWVEAALVAGPSFAELQTTPARPFTAGAKLELVTLSGATLDLTVVSPGLVLPNITMIGQVREKATDLSFDIGIRDLTTTTTQATVFGSGVLPVHNARAFPERGIVTVWKAVEGGLAPIGEAAYQGRTDTALERVVWTNTGHVGDVLAAGSTVRCIAATPTALVNPALTAAVHQRTVTTLRDVAPAARLSAETADLYFAYLKDTTLVVETTNAVPAGPLRTLLDDTLPAGSSVVLLTRHVVNDAFAINPTDRAEAFVPPSLQLIGDPMGPITSGFIEPLSTLREIGLAAQLTIDLGRTPVSFAWEAFAEAPAPAPRIADPTASSIRLRGLRERAIYDVVLRVTDRFGFVTKASVRLHMVGDGTVPVVYPPVSLGYDGATLVPAGKPPFLLVDAHGLVIAAGALAPVPYISPYATEELVTVTDDRGFTDALLVAPAASLSYDGIDLIPAGKAPFHLADGNGVIAVAATGPLAYLNEGDTAQTVTLTDAYGRMATTTVAPSWAQPSLVFASGQLIPAGKPPFLLQDAHGLTIAASAMGPVPYVNPYLTAELITMTDARGRTATTTVEALATFTYDGAELTPYGVAPFRFEVDGVVLAAAATGPVPYVNEGLVPVLVRMIDATGAADTETIDPAYAYPALSFSGGNLIPSGKAPFQLVDAHAVVIAAAATGSVAYTSPYDADEVVTMTDARGLTATVTVPTLTPAVGLSYSGTHLVPVGKAPFLLEDITTDPATVIAAAATGPVAFANNTPAAINVRCTDALGRIAYATVLGNGAFPVSINFLYDPDLGSSQLSVAGEGPLVVTDAHGVTVATIAENFGTLDYTNPYSADEVLTVTDANLDTATVTVLVPFQQTVVVSGLSNVGQTLAARPAGTYRIAYNEGAVLTDPVGPPVKWTVNSGSSTVGWYKAVPGANAAVPLGVVQTATTQAAVETANAGWETTITHPGGNLKLFFEDSNYGANTNSANGGASFTITRLS